VIELKLLAADDWRLWRGLRLQALLEAPEAFGSQLADWRGDGDREERWRGRLSIPGGHDVAASLDAVPVGMVSGVPSGERATELISLWVSPTARGRGVGDALVADVVRWAQGAGATTVHLRVAEGNDAARKLYERHGFRLTGEKGALMPDGVRHELVMELSLTP
jgi:ribosomal protein S18 acetylase RimI-like enzyme